MLRRCTPAPDVEIVHESEGGLVVRYSGDLYIEPKWGYLITRSGHLVESSLEPNFEHAERPLRIGAPSIRRFFWSTRLGKRVDEHDQVVSARHHWEWNYYHFYFDAIGKLELADVAGLGAGGYPWSLGAYVDELPFVRPVIESGRFAQRTWLAPEREYVRCA